MTLGERHPPENGDSSSSGYRRQVLMIRIFLSHNTRDRQWGEWLMRSAAAHGIKAYLAEHDAQPGSLLVPKIEKAIDDSAAVVVLVTDNSLNSVFVQHEVGYARKAKKLIIPVVQLGIASEQLGMLRGLEYIPFDFASPHEGHAQLTAAMLRRLRLLTPASDDARFVVISAKDPSIRSTRTRCLAPSRARRFPSRRRQRRRGRCGA